MLKASAIGAVLIGIVYVGLSFLAAHYHGALRDVPHELLLGTLAWKILGPWGSIFTSCAVVLSCLATAIALATAFSDFLSQEILRTKHSDIICRLLTLVITFAFCFMGFSGIVKLLAPILRIGYPALFMLTLLNISHKLFQFDRGVKVVVPATFITTWLFDFLRLKT
jgi:LIVCS family branched-chain amino acid:cation transporter